MKGFWLGFPGFFHGVDCQLSQHNAGEAHTHQTPLQHAVYAQYEYLLLHMYYLPTQIKVCATNDRGYVTRTLRTDAKHWRSCRLALLHNCYCRRRWTYSLEPAGMQYARTFRRAPITPRLVLCLVGEVWECVSNVSATRRTKTVYFSSFIT